MSHSFIFYRCITTLKNMSVIYKIFVFLWLLFTGSTEQTFRRRCVYVWSRCHTCVRGLVFSRRSFLWQKRVFRVQWLSCSRTVCFQNRQGEPGRGEMLCPALAIFYPFTQTSLHSIDFTQHFSCAESANKTFLSLAYAYCLGLFSAMVGFPWTHW